MSHQISLAALRFRLAVATVLALSASAVASPILWIDDEQGGIGKVDVQTGAVTYVGNAGVALTDIAFDRGGTLWGIGFNNLFKVNTATGVATLVGPTGIPQGNALVFSTTGVLYASSATTPLLYTVNTTTGAATSIGSTGFSSAGDLAFNAGALYLSDTGNYLVKISLGPTPSGVEVGPIGFNNVYGLATGDDGVLYGVAGTQIFVVDTDSGRGRLKSDYAGHGLIGANGTSFVIESIPEPTLTLGIGTVMACNSMSSRRRRHH